MDEKDWEILTVLHETKNITRAAKKLFISQPALSLRLRNIEQYFNVGIVLRGKKGIQFTEEGEYLAEQAREHLRGMARIRDTLLNMRSTLSGVIRIGSTNYTTKYFLPHILREFRKRYPAVEFRVSTGVSKNIIQLLNDHDAHIGFIRGSLPWDGERDLLFKEKMYIVNKDPFNIGDLGSMPMIHYQIAPPNQDHLDRWWNERFAFPPSMSMIVDRADTCFELIAQGFGYGFLPASILAGQTDLHCLEMIYNSGKPLERAVWMIYYKEMHQLRLVRTFADMVRDLDFSPLSSR